MSDGEEQIAFRVPADLKKDFDRTTEYGEKTALLREFVEEYARGTSSTEDIKLRQTKAQREQIREEIHDLKAERRKIDTSIENKEDKLTELDAKISNLEAKSDQIETVAETLEESLLDGERIHQGRVPDQYNVETVIQRLKERNPDVPEWAFRVAEPGEPVDWTEVDENDGATTTKKKDKADSSWRESVSGGGTA